MNASLQQPKAHIAEILQPYFEKGLQLWLEEGALRFKAPKELLQPPLMSLLKANKPAILDWLQEQAAIDKQAPEAQVVDEYPLAYTQGAIWMLYRFAPNSPAYNTTFACILTKPLNEAAVRQAFHALLIRHPVLRSTFHDTDVGPRQRVWNHLPMPLHIEDAAHLNEAALQAVLNQEADAPFDLSQSSCLRVRILRNTVRGDILIATIQHVGADLWALLIVAQDIKTFYDLACRGEPLSVAALHTNYHQHVDWQQRFVQSEAGRHERRYWQQQLLGAPMTVSLPADKPRPPVLQLQTRVWQEKLAAEQYKALRQYCRQQGVTPFVLVQAAFQLLVHHQTGATDFLLGTPTMGRSRKGMDQVVGDFANPVVLRARIALHETLQSHLQRVKATMLSAMEHQEYPFPLVVQDSNPPRDSSRTPLFQLMLVWHQGSADQLPQDDFIREVLPMSGPRGAPYDVMLAISDLGDRFEFNWTWQTSLFEENSVQGFAFQLMSLLQTMVESGTADLPPAQTGLHRLVEKALGTNRMNPLRTWQEASLAQWDHLVIEQVLTEPAPATLRRLFIAAPQQEQMQDLEWLTDFDDVVYLPYLPRASASGEPDLFALQSIPVWRRDTAEQRGQPSQALLLRELHLLPTHLPSSLPSQLPTERHSKTGSGPEVSISKAVLAKRPDAWIQGEPLTQDADAPMHLFAALQQTVTRHPDKGIAFLNDDDSLRLLSYANLLRDAEQAAAGIDHAGLQRGDIVLLQMPFTEAFFALWWGCIRNGVRPLVVAMPEQYNERSGVAMKLYNVAHRFDRLTVVADADRVQDTRDWLGPEKTVINVEDLLQQGALIAESHDFSDADNVDDVAFLQLTSGSTGTPKAIQITHQGVLHHVAASRSFNDYRVEDVSLNWLPFDHVVPILTTHLKDVVLGIKQIQVPTARILSQPLLWLTLMSRFRVAYSWAPNFAYQRVLEGLAEKGLAEESLAEQGTQKDFLQTLDLSSVRLLMNAGEQVLAPVVQQFSTALAPAGLHADAVQPAFGMAEACTCMTYNNDASQHLSVFTRPTRHNEILDIVSKAEATHGFVDLGGVVPGVEVRITDTRNQLVREGVIGRMQIRGPVVTPGYLNNPQANEEAFVGDGWFNSGDLGFIWNRRLVLTGREKEMIVVNGANYYCFELEQVVASLPGVKPTFVAATAVSVDATPGNTNSQSSLSGGQEALVLFYVRSDDPVDPDLLPQQIRARVVEAFGVSAAYVLEVPEDGFYKTTSGKIQRSQFRKQFESGFYDAELDTLASPQEHATTDTLFSLQSSHVPVSEIPFPDVQYRLCSEPQVTDYPALCDLFNESSGPEAHVVVELESDSSALDFARTLGTLSQAIDAAEGWNGTLYLLLKRGQPQWVWWIRPLLRTLQQESACTRIVCLLTVGDEPAALPPAGRDAVQVGWQEDGLYRHWQLNNTPVPVVNQNPIRHQGVYLVTGGLGGLAQPLCDYLIRHKARVILTGRHALENDHTRRQRFLQIQQRLSAQAVCYQVLSSWSDVEVDRVVSAGLQALNADQLDGVFHLAGELPSGALADLNPDSWQRSVSAKVQGSLALASWLQQNAPGSLLVQYGSVNGFFGGRYAAAYSYANAFQSALTCSLNQTGNLRSWCLNWSLWHGVGMASAFSEADVLMAANKGFLPLQPEQDSHWIDHLLTLPPQNYFIGLNRHHATIRNCSDLFSHSEVRCELFLENGDNTEAAPPSFWQSALTQPLPRVKQDTLAVYPVDGDFPRNSLGNIDLDVLRTRSTQEEAPVLPETELERLIAQIWNDVLDQPILNVERTFFEYGGHSINATQVVAALNRALSQQECTGAESVITVAQLFQYPTVRRLAASLGDDKVDTLSLTVGDCIQRASHYRLDEINPQSSSEITLVFLPTSSGLPNLYAALAGQLDQYRLKVMTLPLVEPGDDPSNSLQESARQCLALLQKNGLMNGKTILLGWSMAGVLGYEILRQTLGSGNTRPTVIQSLPSLLMLDSGFADGLNEITFDAAFQQLMFAVELGLTTEQYAVFNAQPEDEKWHWLATALQSVGVTLEETTIRQSWQTWSGRLNGLLNYQIDRPIGQSIVMRGLKAALYTHGCEDLGWGQEAAHLRWDSVDADHQGIVRHPQTTKWIQQQIHSISELTHGMRDLEPV